MTLLGHFVVRRQEDSKNVKVDELITGQVEHRLPAASDRAIESVFQRLAYH